MVIHPPAHFKLESAIEARLAAGKVLLAAHVTHASQCTSCAQLFGYLARMAEPTRLPPAGLNQRMLRAVTADQQQSRSKADRREAVGAIFLALGTAAVIFLAVTTSSTWLAVVALYWHINLGT